MAERIMSKVSQNKRPVRQLSIHEKLGAIQRVHEGESKASVARVIGVPESTLRGWCKNEEKLTALAIKASPSPEPAEEQGGPSDSKRTRLQPQTRVPTGGLDEALWYWLLSQQQRLPGRGNMNGSWFWKWYKQLFPENYKMEPLPLVKTKTESVLINFNNNNIQEESKENKIGTGAGQISEDDYPPETASEALKHGEKFLRWLEKCSDPEVTAVQILQFRYLLNNVRSCAERGENKVKLVTRTKRK